MRDRKQNGPQYQGGVVWNLCSTDIQAMLKVGGGHRFLQQDLASSAGEIRLLLATQRSLGSVLCPGEFCLSLCTKNSPGEAVSVGKKLGRGPARTKSLSGV